MRAASWMICALVAPIIAAFVTTTTQRQRPSFLSRRPLLRPTSHTAVMRHSTRLFMTFIDSNDPFQILNLNPTADKKEIKRAYKRMALKYHPDVILTKDSTEEQRKRANDRFAKINWAYASLSGKGGAESSSSSTASGAGYTPPHRRKQSPYTYSAPSGSTDWRDYVPKYDDDEQYDTGGDSFEKIFSDLFKGAAVAGVRGAAAGTNVFRDFVEFLENMSEGSYTQNESEDSELNILLTVGSLDQVANEMDDTQLVVQQLEQKKKNVVEELMMRQADVAQSTGYLEKLDLEEKVAELEARKNVVEGYLQKARHRLLLLQTRYKELVVGGENDSYAGGRTRYDSSPRGYESQQTSYSSSAGDYSSSRDTTTSSRSDSSKDEDAWKHQGFGSSGRRGSSRRSRGRTSRSREPEPQRASYTPPPRQETAPPPPRQERTYSTPPPPPPPRQERTYTTSTTKPRPSEPWVPPHRRSASAATQAQQDKKRLRELKVDEEFDQLKRDLGL